MHEVVYPASTRIPMGWAHSVPIMIHVALRVAFRSVSRPIINLNRTGEDAGEIRIGPNDIAAGIYVDNLIVVGSNSDQVGETHVTMVAALDAANLRCSADSIVGPTDVVDYVGLRSTVTLW